MKKIYTLPFLALLFLPFCANRKAEKHIAISSREISLAVELDVLKFACERRLYRLENDIPAPRRKVEHTPSLEGIRASDAVHQ